MNTDTKSRYQDIISRLEKATGPDRELDADVFFALGGERYGALLKWPGECVYFGVFPDFSASLDATIALIERVLPGWGYTFHKDDENTATSLWTPEGKAAEQHYQVQGNTLSLSALAALFHALEAKTAVSMDAKADNMDAKA